MRLTFTGLLTFVCVLSMSAQSFFNPIDDGTVPSDIKSGDRGLIPVDYDTYELDHQQLWSTLNDELTLDNFGKTTTLVFPFEGEQLEFTIQRTSNFHPNLAAKYPEIGSYYGKTRNGKEMINFSISPWSFYAEIKGSGDSYSFLQPYSHQNNNYIISYDYSALIPVGGFDFKCGNHEVHIDHNDLPAQILSEALGTARGENVQVKTYRLAVATVAEFTDFAGGVPQAIAKINEALTLINAIYEGELAVRFELIADNDDLIYTEAISDPYLTVNDGAGLLAQNQTNLDATIGSAAYDAGHVFTRSCINGLGGIAALASICLDTNKGRGVTCWSSLNASNIVTRIMAHELGHSAASPHSWNRCLSSQDQLAPGNAYEPGSGSTIMSYAGSCGSDDIQSGPDPYFNIGSLVRMYEYRDNGTGSTCGSFSDTNSKPDISILSQGGVTIPMMTPFSLTAEGTDMENDDLTYCWEQYDLGPSAPLGMPIGNGPSFRSYPPVDSPTRVFPKWGDILSGSMNIREVLATYTRSYTFRVTARDDHRPAGGVMWEEVKFECTEDAGPFKVTAPSSSPTWVEGTVQQVTWDVANTDKFPVNCQAVNIKMALSGTDFSITLAENIPNTGSADILVPNANTTSGRILVEAADNLFFNVNSGSVTVNASATPGLALEFLNVNEEVCLPGNAIMTISSSAIQGYSDPITYAVTGLPAGASANFSTNPANPGDDVMLTIDFDNTVATDMYNLTLTANGANISELSRPFTINALSQDFTGFSLNTPVNEASGVAEVPNFDWQDLAAATQYDIQISSNPAFEMANTTEAMGISSNSYTPSQPLMKNTLYYWRVRPSNICSTGDWSDIFVFHTINFACSILSEENIGLAIPAGNGDASATLNIAQSGVISDLNVSVIDLDFQAINFITLELESPDGKKEILYEKGCNGPKLNIGFDDQAALAIPCPPTDGGTYLPAVGTLSSFNNDNTQGDWKLNINNSGSVFDPGVLNTFTLEVCSNFTPQDPTLITNEILLVKTADAQWIEDQHLECTDPDNTAAELIYTLVSLPEFGTIDANGTNLAIGGTFSQAMINDRKVKYEHTGTTEVDDSFIFTVNDGAGGFVGPTVFNISVGDNNPSLSIESLNVDVFSLFPNPTANELWVNTEEPSSNRTISVVDAQGRMLFQKDWNKGNRIKINTSDLSNGVYYLRIQEDNKVGTKKFAVLR